MLAASCGLFLIFLPPKTWSQAPAPAKDQPGELATFFRTVPNPLVERKGLGALSGPDKATFNAIIATAPANPDIKVEGIEVDLEHGEMRWSVYLDEDGLEEFARTLTHLSASRQRIWEQLKSRSGYEGVRGGATTGAMNRAIGVSNENALGGTVLNVGWYWENDESGVTINCAGRCGVLHFRDQTLVKVVDFINSGRQYLKGR